MLLLLLALAALGAWLWLGKAKKRRKIPAAWLGIGGTLAGAVLVAKGMPVIGALVATGSGLWLRYGGGLMGQPSAPPAPRPPTAQLSRAEAADLLGVPVNADREAVQDAYRRLMARNHPDAGGSVGLAARINAARELLLKSQD
jgi:hypothetical protein